MEYLLMHKDDVCGSMSFDDKNGRLIEFKELNKEFCPYLGYSNLTKIKQWWEMRKVYAKIDEAVYQNRILLDKMRIYTKIFNR